MVTNYFFWFGGSIIWRRALFWRVKKYIWFLQNVCSLLCVSHNGSAIRLQTYVYIYILCPPQHRHMCNVYVIITFELCKFYTNGESFYIWGSWKSLISHQKDAKAPIKHWRCVFLFVSSVCVCDERCHSAYLHLMLLVMHF